MSDWYILNPDKTVTLADTEELKTVAYRQLESAEKIIAKTNFGEVQVSTVFLGLDHSYNIGDKPILFETLVFGGPEDQECLRYHTHKDAVRGHEEVCRRQRSGLSRKELEAGALIIEPLLSQSEDVSGREEPGESVNDDKTQDQNQDYIDNLWNWSR